MCYAKPGPRCSGHTREEYNSAVEQHGADSLQAMKALDAWLRTPEGIKKLRTEGHHELALQYEQERAEAIKAYHESREVVAEDQAGIHPDHAALDPEVGADRAKAHELALSPETPASTLAMLAERFPLSRDNVASNPNTPVATLETLALENSQRVQSAVASNPNTPGATLAMLAEKFPGTRKVIAYNPNTPVATLESLGKVRDQYVRGAVAKNPSTPIAMLERLARDRAIHVRANAASNPNTPTATLDRLANDRDASVRKAVASNPTTTDATLEALANADSFDWESDEVVYAAEDALAKRRADEGKG